MFAVLLTLLRPKLFGVKLYKPMLKNMGLSLLPLLVLIATILLMAAVLLYVNTFLGFVTGIAGGGPYGCSSSECRVLGYGA